VAEYDPDRLTWAVLLGRWIEFARSAVALPTEGDGLKLRDSVADIIMLQAVWFALAQMDDLDRQERMLGLDRAEVLIDRHAGALSARWGDAIPSQLAELIADVRAARRAAASPSGAGDDGAGS
jgi:hypothetical protein